MKRAGHGRSRPVHAAAQRRHAGQRGFTLIELMVALVIGLLVAAAAVAALIVARQGFNSVDSGTQLRENVRFASSLIQRIGVQAGYVDVYMNRAPLVTDPAGISGFDNTDVGVVPATGPTFPAGTGVNGSDALVVRFWGVSTRPNDVTAPADGSMINCAGIAEPERPGVPATSIFHIVTSSSGEPTLVCTYRDPTSGLWARVPLVQGVESMQVLYGVDGVTPNAVPPAPFVGADTVPERYLTATQMVVGGNSAATLDNWRRVRSLRIGLLVRGPASTGVDRAGTAMTYAVLGSGFSAAGDTGANLTTVADGRLRQHLVFNVHLRNPQDQRSPPE